MNTFYWSRRPGQFVNRKTGESISEQLVGIKPVGPKFTGTVREWYETLVETIYTAAGTQRDSNTRIFVSPTVRTILECSVLFKPFVDLDLQKEGVIGTISGMKVVLDSRLKNEIKLVNGTFESRVIVKDLDII